MGIRILIADDHHIVRQGLRALLGEHADLTVVGEAGNGKEAVELARQLAPDVVVMDIKMPELNGIEATRRIRAEQPGIKVIALSMFADDHFIQSMEEAGASAYLLKGCAFEELVLAIREVAAGRKYVSPGTED